MWQGICKIKNCNGTYFILWGSKVTISPVSSHLVQWAWVVAYLFQNRALVCSYLFSCCYNTACNGQEFSWAYGSRELTSMVKKQRHGEASGAANETSHLDPQGGGREHTGNGGRLLKLQSLPPSHTCSSTPHLLILPKQFHQLGIKYSNMSLWGHSQSITGVM